MPPQTTASSSFSQYICLGSIFLVVDLAQSKGTFWQDYKFTNPTTKKIEPKQMYCEKLEDAVVCGGIYK